MNGDPPKRREAASSWSRIKIFHDTLKACSRCITMGRRSECPASHQQKVVWIGRGECRDRRSKIRDYRWVKPWNHTPQKQTKHENKATGLSSWCRCRTIYSTVVKLLSTDLNVNISWQYLVKDTSTCKLACQQELRAYSHQHGAGPAGRCSNVFARVECLHLWGSAHSFSLQRPHFTVLGHWSINTHQAALPRSRLKLNYGAGREFGVGPEFGAMRKQPIIPGNSRVRSGADEEDRVTWLDLRPG